MAFTVALAGDTMLGRGVAAALASGLPQGLFAPEVVEATRSADLFVLNLECCISERGEPWPAPGKPFFFRAPPAAAEVLNLLGVDCVTLANNHALDFGYDALSDTFAILQDAGIEWVGAGTEQARARAARMLDVDGTGVAVLGVTDHPADFAAAPDRPGVAHANLRTEVPAWLVDAVTSARRKADEVLVTVHWGPNMNPHPLPYVRHAAQTLVEADATAIAGHSAHVFHGVAPPVLYDLGDFVDDYAVDPLLRNDLGLLFFVTLEEGTMSRIEALPLELDYCYTRVATGEAFEWIERRFKDACRALGTTASTSAGRLVVEG